MKTLLILFTFLSSLSFNADTKPSMVEIRNMLIKAADSKKANEALQDKLALFDQQNSVIKGYKGASVMIEAKHVISPLGKLSKFKKGKAIIEEAIKADPNNFELRYLRFSIQTNAPSFLGYADNIESDKKLLIDKIATIKDQDLTRRAASYLISSKTCSAAEMTKLKQWKTR